MLMAYLTLISGLLISAVAIFYSVAGLTAIFSAAVWPIIIMGVSLEVAKLVATVWVKQNWTIAPRLLKGYLVIAITILMVITSLGIFGFLSKAHSDQTLVSGEVQSKIAVYDEKIITAKENINASRKQLKQMDEAVDQIMGRSTDEKGASKAVAIRRGQSKDRARLFADIEAEQKTISRLNEERAPIAAEVRKVEAEVGPIKYIAAFVYGDNPDANVLEKAVTWVIILIVVVFDPLAVMLLLASQYSFALLRPKEEQVPQPSINDFAPQPETYVEKTSAAEVPVDSDPPIPAFLLKKNQPDFDAINLELAEAAVVQEPTEPESIDFEIQDTASAKDTEVETLPIVENYEIMHTNDGVTLIDKSGKATDIHLDLTMDERPGDYIETPVENTYVQNEEQKESDTWTKIVNKTITEEEYLRAVQQNKKV